MYYLNGHTAYIFTYIHKTYYNTRVYASRIVVVRSSQYYIILLLFMLLLLFSWSEHDVYRMHLLPRIAGYYSITCGKMFSVITVYRRVLYRWT